LEADEIAKIRLSAEKVESDLGEGGRYPPNMSGILVVDTVPL
jgi:hypothetical protein